MKNFLCFLFFWALFALPANAQTTLIGQPITSTPSAAAEGSHVFKTSAGALYSILVTSGGSAGYVLLFNSTTAPADGAVTPNRCFVLAANSTLTATMQYPMAFGTGITAVFSTTGCFTKTVSATAFFSAQFL